MLAGCHPKSSVLRPWECTTFCSLSWPYELSWSSATASSSGLPVCPSENLPVSRLHGCQLPEAGGREDGPEGMRQIHNCEGGSRLGGLVYNVPSPSFFPGPASNRTSRVFLAISSIKTPSHTMEFLTAAAFSGHSLPEAMAQLKQLKEASWAALNETGAFDLDRHDTLRSPTSCVKRQSGRTPVLQRGPRLLPSSPGHGLSTRKGNDVCK